MKVKKFILIKLFFIFIILINSNVAKAGDCETTISSATTSQLTCADDDSLTFTSAGSISYNNHKTIDLEDEKGVQITNNGTIETANNSNKQKPIHAQSSLDFTITNSGTINSDNNEGIYLDYAENVTITNNTGATISAEGANAIEGKNIGWCDKAGNNDNCQSSLSSSGSTGVGLTLHNHGMISSTNGTVWFGSGSGGSPRSRGNKIYNYDGGTIKSTSGNSPIVGKFFTDSEIINYEGATIESASRFGIDTEYGSNITIDNRGTITSDRNSFYCRECSGVTFTNSGTISSTNTGTNSGTVLIDRQEDSDAAHTITNSGTIESAYGAAIQLSRNTGGTTINNTGTLTSSTSVIGAGRTKNLTINNHGTITSTGEDNTTSFGIGFGNDSTSVEAGENVVLNNFGTISAINGDADAIKVGDYHDNKNFNGLTINNSGTISGGDNSIVMANSNNTGLEIITKGDGTYVGEIELNSTSTTMTLDCSISKDQDIELHGKTNITITNNLCGNDTYVILDSNKNKDTDNLEANGYLRIYGEELDVVSNNKKYRTEIFSNSIKNLFKSLSDIKERSTFYTQSKRNNIYENSIKGVSGYFLKNDYAGEKKRTFLTYFEQNANFNSKEKSKSENLAFGYDIKTNTDNLSIKPLFGISSNKITDIETETGEIKRNNFLGQFFALNTNYKLTRKIEKNSDLSLTVIGEYGAHRLPKYVSNFTHGDLSVDEAIDQVLGIGFDVEYSINNENGFILKPYTGLAFNKTLSGKVKMNDINAVRLKEDISQDHTMNGAVIKKIGLSLTKNTEDIGFNLNFEHSNQDNVVSNNVNFSISKKLQKIAKKRKEEQKLDPELEKLFNQLQIIRENERLALIANKLNKENQVMKDLIIQLIKENQKIKTENKLLIKNIN